MFYTLNEIVVIIFKTVEVMILLRILTSWVPIGRGTLFTNFLRDFTDPVLKPFRVALHLAPGMGLDLSPIIALFILYQIEMLVLNLLRL
ncbi:MAG TPA: YggT family protein [Candidatus Wallbacteria bacterium]|nr:YggT family protein [Candidatus Wallbacteria bacterium]